jgi:hypothetical protein
MEGGLNISSPVQYRRSLVMHILIIQFGGTVHISSEIELNSFSCDLMLPLSEIFELKKMETCFVDFSVFYAKVPCIQ